MDFYEAETRYDSFVDEVENSDRGDSQNAFEIFTKGVLGLEFFRETVAEAPDLDFQEFVEDARSSTVRFRINWPSDLDKKFFLRWKLCCMAADGKFLTYNFAHSYLGESSSQLSDNHYTFIEKIFRPVSDEIRRRARLISDKRDSVSKDFQVMSGQFTKSESGIKVFVSHSSRDLQVAKALVDTLIAAYSLETSEIRCTTLPGYKLQSGADTDSVLRRESVDAKCFVVILSPFSIGSTYVIFEMGARWGAERSIVPGTVGGLEPGAKLGPLAGVNAKNLAVLEDAIDLIQDIGKEIGQQEGALSAWNAKVGSLVESASCIVEKQFQGESEYQESLELDEQNLLSKIAGMIEAGISVTDRSLDSDGSGRIAIRHLLNQLKAKGMLRTNQSMINRGRSVKYSLTGDGEAWVYKQSKVK